MTNLNMRWIPLRIEEANLELGSSKMTNIISSLVLLMILTTFFADRKMDAIWPYTLTYETKGLQCKADGCELEVWVKNLGWAPQRDVRFELPRYSSEFREMYVSRAYKLIKENSANIINLGTVHSGSFRLISLMYPKGTTLSYKLPLRLEIYSSDGEATYAGPSSDDFSLPWWWYYLTGFLCILGVLSALTRLFEGPKGRYIRLIRVLEGQTKTFAKAKSGMSRARKQISEIPEQAIELAEQEIEKWPRLLRPKTRRGVKAPQISAPVQDIEKAA